MHVSHLLEYTREEDSWKEKYTREGETRMIRLYPITWRPPSKTAWEINPIKPILPPP